MGWLEIHQKSSTLVAAHWENNGSRSGSTPGKIRIVLVLDNLDISGAEKVAINLLRNASLFSYIEMSGVVCMDDRLGCVGAAPNLRHLTGDIGNSDGLWTRLRKARLAVSRLRRATVGVDLLLAVTPPAALLCKLAVIGRRMPVAAWVHFDYQGIQRDVGPRGRRVRGWVQRLLYLKFIPRFQRIVFVSDACRRSFPVKHNEADTWLSLPNAFVPESFLPSAESTTAHKMSALKRDGAPVLAFVGRLFRQKRWEGAVQVAELLHDRGFRCHMAFIGDGLDRERFVATIAASRARDSMHYLGSDRNVEPAMALADGLILTSLFEAWPTVILEAFSLRVPVFAYDCPSGPKQMLGDGQRGVLSRETPQDLTDAIVEYFDSDPKSRTERVLRAVQFAETLSPQNVIPLWERDLPKLLGRYPRPE